MKILRYLIKSLIVAPHYLANYGYTDGSGEYYITIDTDKCDGCAECVKVCPAQILEIITDDYDQEVAVIKEKNRKNIKYDCAPCKPITNRPELPCVRVCKPGAIKHSW